MIGCRYECGPTILRHRGKGASLPPFISPPQKNHSRTVWILYILQQVYVSFYANQFAFWCPLVPTKATAQDLKGLM